MLLYFRYNSKFSLVGVLSNLTLLDSSVMWTTSGISSEKVLLKKRTVWKVAFWKSSQYDLRLTWHIQGTSGISSEKNIIEKDNISSVSLYAGSFPKEVFFLYDKNRFLSKVTINWHRVNASSIRVYFTCASVLSMWMYAMPTEFKGNRDLVNGQDST